MRSLGKDELQLISEKLTFSPDYTRFRSVCGSWRSAAPKRPPLPWLIVCDGTDSNKTTGAFKFYQFSFETNEFLQISELPELSLSSSSSSFIGNKIDCFGYSRGWMALYNQSTSSVFLFNPLTKSSIDLPVHKRLSYNASDLAGDDNNDDDDGDDNDPLPSINFCLTSGELLSDCFALVYHKYSQRIWYCKVGCTNWIEMPNPGFYEYSLNNRICCYHGKTFIVSHGEVFVCDFSLFGENPINLQKIVSLSQYDAGNHQIEDSWLVESDGHLLLVLYRFFGFGQYNFQVFKVEFGREQAKLVELKSLGDKALFLSPQTTTFSLTASKYSGCKSNSIYFLDDYAFYDERTLMLSIYDFEKGCSVTINDDAAPLDVDCEHFGWFIPNLLN